MHGICNLSYVTETFSTSPLIQTAPVMMSSPFPSLMLNQCSPSHYPPHSVKPALLPPTQWFPFSYPPTQCVKPALLPPTPVPLIPPHSGCPSHTPPTHSVKPALLPPTPVPLIPPHTVVAPLIPPTHSVKPALLHTVSTHSIYTQYRRRDSDRSQYRSYLDYVREIGENMGFKVQEDTMRIPSSKRVSIPGPLLPGCNN